MFMRVLGFNLLLGHALSFLVFSMVMLVVFGFNQLIFINSYTSFCIESLSILVNETISLGLALLLCFSHFDLSNMLCFGCFLCLCLCSKLHLLVESSVEAVCAFCFLGLLSHNLGILFTLLFLCMHFHERVFDVFHFLVCVRLESFSVLVNESICHNLLLGIFVLFLELGSMKTSCSIGSLLLLVLFFSLLKISIEVVFLALLLGQDLFCQRLLGSSMLDVRTLLVLLLYLCLS